MAKITPQYLYECTLCTDCVEADAIFVSCSVLRIMDVFDAIERQAGKPVLCSDHAMIWKMFRMGELGERYDGYGTLLRDH